MKRSQINRAVKEGEAFIESLGFALPPWARWEPKRWAELGDAGREVYDNMLGWDVTDFAKGDYDRFGLLLFTIRNGNPKRDKKPYAEKLLLVAQGQHNPMHFHWRKMEDIINRGGGRLALELWNSGPDEGLAGGPVRFRVDGVERSVEAGGTVVLERGESICLVQGVYHRFWSEGGSVLAGEVSMVNDDAGDNRFTEELGRYCPIEEDEPPYRLLCGDYGRFAARRN